jgi:tRNA (guanine37-N1)-methyltransferase
VLRIDVITIFPGLFEAFLGESIVGIAIRENLIGVRVHDLRDFTTDRHRTVDDAPYGGGPGMVMKPEPLVAAVESVVGPKGPARTGRAILLSPQGRPLDQQRLAEMAQEESVALVCGRYEGIDQRAVELAIDEEISIGDYVLSGGEIPAMAVIEGVARLIPGVLGNAESAAQDSFQRDELEGPQYTRPARFRDLEVPAVLRSGDHAAVARWRAERATEITRRRRPDLIRATSEEEES